MGSSRGPVARQRAQATGASETPSLRRIVASGQRLVKPDWNRFRPTKAVSAKNHFDTNSGLPSTASASETRMKDPAKMRIRRSTFMKHSIEVAKGRGREKPSCGLVALVVDRIEQ